MPRKFEHSNIMILNEIITSLNFYTYSISLSKNTTYNTCTEFYSLLLFVLQSDPRMLGDPASFVAKLFIGGGLLLLLILLIWGPLLIISLINSTNVSNPPVEVTIDFGVRSFEVSINVCLCSVCVCVCVHVRVRVYMQLYVHECMYVCECVHMWMCVRNDPLYSMLFNNNYFNILI